MAVKQVSCFTLQHLFCVSASDSSCYMSIYSMFKTVQDTIPPNAMSHLHGSRYICRNKKSLKS